MRRRRAAPETEIFARWVKEGRRQRKRGRGAKGDMEEGGNAVSVCQRRGCFKKMEESVVLKTLAIGQGQAYRNRVGQKWVMASNMIGWKEEGVGEAGGGLEEGCHLLRMCGEVVRWIRGGLAKILKGHCRERGKENRETKNDLQAATEGQAEVGYHKSEIASVSRLCDLLQQHSAAWVREQKRYEWLGSGVEFSWGWGVCGCN